MDQTSTDLLLIRAKQICQQRSVRLTPQRLQVLTLMANHQGAISAYDLLYQLQLSLPQAKPPTVYRALDFLLQQGFIHKIESTNNYIICHHFDDNKHTFVLLMCQKCQHVTEHHLSTIDHLLQHIADKQQFQLTNSVVEIHGLCQACQIRYTLEC